MKRYRNYLLDLDGTIYRGSQIIPEAIPFIQQLRQRELPFLYVTNNSSASAEEVANRLTKMGLPTNAAEVYTSSMATAAYLSEREKNGARVMVIGESGLTAALQEAGFTLCDEAPQYVVVGIDRQFTYDKLARASAAIRAGAVFIATNRDAALPGENGLTPGNGSLCAAVAVASGVEPVVIGKPEKWIISYAMQRLGAIPEETLIVGDNLHTDIEAGYNSNIDSLLVLSGYSTEADAKQHPFQPTYILNHLTEWTFE